MNVDVYCSFECKKVDDIIRYENRDIAIAMSSSRADPVLPWLGVFKCLYQSHCTDWGHLNVKFRQPMRELGDGTNCVTFCVTVGQKGDDFTLCVKNTLNSRSDTAN